MVESELGLIPKGWEVKQLKDISANIITGKTPSTKNQDSFNGNIPFVRIPDMHEQVYVTKTEKHLGKLGTLSKKIVPKNAVIVSCIATPGLVSLASEDCVTNQQINTIVCKSESMCYFIFFLLRSLSAYIRMLASSGSTTPNLNKSEFSKIRVTIPTVLIEKKYYNLVRSSFNLMLDFQKEIAKLSNIRDTLLPKLMSGEIRIPVEDL